MRKVILPLLLIITMAFCVSVATAADFSSSGPYNSANGWNNSVNWNGNAPSGNAEAHASHALTTAPSGSFTCDVEFTIKNQNSSAWVILYSADGTETQLGYWNGHYIRNHVYLTAQHMPIGTYHAKFSSTDGRIWHTDIAGMKQDLTITSPPVRIYIAARNNGTTSTAPTINKVTFLSTDTAATPTPTASPTATPTPTASPTATPTPEPTSTPAPVADNGNQPVYNVEEIQNFYDNIYPTLYGPQANYITTTPASPASPAVAGFTVSGSVTSAVDDSAIADASVVLGDKLQKTDSLGNYKFEGVANGAADIAVSADGFASQTQSVNVNADQTVNFALKKASADGSPIASAANETNTTVPGNATVKPTMAPTTVPSPTQTKSPGFEGIVAAIAIIGTAGLLVYLNRKH